MKLGVIHSWFCSILLYMCKVLVKANGLFLTTKKFQVCWMQWRISALSMQENNILRAHLEKYHNLVDQTAWKYSEITLLVISIN